MTSPPVTRIQQPDTHRLVLSRRSEGNESVLARIADDKGHLAGLLDLDNATSDRAAAEHGLLPGIGADELMSGVPHARIVNGAFVYAHPLGGRFNAPDRSAWYAGFELETSQAEVAWHKSVEFGEINWFEESVIYDDYLADFVGDYHDIRGDANFRKCLDPDNYIASQPLAQTLVREQSSGIIYPSTRQREGVCLACFRPTLVDNVRKGQRYRFTWAGSPEPVIDVEQAV